MHDYEKARIKKFLHYAWRVWLGLIPILLYLTAMEIGETKREITKMNITLENIYKYSGLETKELQEIDKSINETITKSQIETRHQEFMKRLKDIDGNGKIEQWEYREAQR